MELFAASRAVARSASVTPRALNETVSRIWMTRSTVRCGRAGMRLTLARPSDQFRSGTCKVVGVALPFERCGYTFVYPQICTCGLTHLPGPRRNRKVGDDE